MASLREVRPPAQLHASDRGSPELRDGLSVARAGDGRDRGGQGLPGEGHQRRPLPRPDQEAPGDAAGQAE
eukprot:999850-Alexandrium_andersonii.AAC.1